MARCENCIHQKVCLHMANIQNDTYAYMGVNFNVEACEHYSQTEDVVEVVRCKDCQYSCFIRSCSKYECRKGCGALKYATDFCSYGERKVQE